MRIRVHTYEMASEAAVREEIASVCWRADAGDVLVFPEYAAYTAEESERTREVLQRVARERRIGIVTTLNLRGDGLLDADPDRRYNTLVVFTPKGEAVSAAAKITPQSFEMMQYSERYPAIGVTPYSAFRRVALTQGEDRQQVVFAVCSDLYLLLAGGAQVYDLSADILMVPGNFGRGAEKAVRRLLTRFRTSGAFRRTVFSNPWQQARKEGQQPVALEARDDLTYTGEVHRLTGEERLQLVQDNVLFYVDETVPHFVQMAQHTPMDDGRLTMPMSRIHPPLLVYPDDFTIDLLP